MKESAIQNEIRLALGRVAGLCLWRNNSGVVEARQGYRITFGVGNPGGADLIGLYRGRFVAVEVKTDTGRQTDDQKRFQQLVERCGGIYKILRSADEAKAWIASL